MAPKWVDLIGGELVEEIIYMTSWGERGGGACAASDKLVAVGEGLQPFSIWKVPFRVGQGIWRGFTRGQWISILPRGQEGGQQPLINHIIL